MAENTINDFNTLPEQVQINKDNIKTNTADITKLKDDISKIKPNAWEERKFNLDGDENSDLINFTTYNPITDTNTPVNIQKSFTDKDTYSIKEPVNSYSFFTSGSSHDASMSIYAVCTTPSNTFIDLLNLDDQKESQPSIILITAKTETGITKSTLDINCTNIKANITKTRYLEMGTPDNMASIDTIANGDVDLPNSLLTGAAISQYYLKKTDASNTYLTKKDYDKRFDTGAIILTAQGLNKIKALDDTPNKTIELHVPSDFLELMQLSGNKDLKLQIVYNDSILYDNIVLHPNRTIEDYDNISSSSAKTIWYTGQAVIVLASQSDGLFDITYSNGNLLGLHLITTF